MTGISCWMEVSGKSMVQVTFTAFRRVDDFSITSISFILIQESFVNPFRGNLLFLLSSWPCSWSSCFLLCHCCLSSPINFPFLSTLFFSVLNFFSTTIFSFSILFRIVVLALILLFFLSHLLAPLLVIVIFYSIFIHLHCLSSSSSSSSTTPGRFITT